MTTTRCLCSSYEFGNTVEGQTQPEWVGYTTECSQSTTNLFAQGHDAKLVGYLVRAELAGEEIRVGSVTGGSAVQMARRVSEALAAKAQAQLDAAKARLAKKAAAAANKQAKRSATKATKAETPAELLWRSAKIKVGRWTYDAQIETKTGDATYATKLGGNKMVEKGQYKVV
jgi:4-hydroxyphenylpyruvate dioxygenase-like putative hemolysin